MTAILITTAAAVTVHAANFLAADMGQRLSHAKEEADHTSKD
ncbi:MAG: hypothetical protein ACQERR_10340 [Pseudomonadota bacterium]